MVRDKTHNELKAKYERLVMENDALLRQWNALVRRINARGGEEFLERGTIVRENKAPQFSDSEIKIMIKLCHPDKHNNSADSTLMTQTLLGMRKK